MHELEGTNLQQVSVHFSGLAVSFGSMKCETSRSPNPSGWIYAQPFLCGGGDEASGGPSYQDITNVTPLKS